MKPFLRRISRVYDSSNYHPIRSNTKYGNGDRPRVPEGHVPVYVGEEMVRFAIKAELLGRPAISELLRRSAAEYGYEQRGVLRIPCPVPLFRRLLDLVDGGGEDADVVSVDELLRSLPDEIRQD